MVFQCYFYLQRSRFGITHSLYKLSIFISKFKNDVTLFRKPEQERAGFGGCKLRVLRHLVSPQFFLTRYCSHHLDKICMTLKIEKVGHGDIDVTFEGRLFQRRLDIWRIVVERISWGLQNYWSIFRVCKVNNHQTFIQVTDVEPATDFFFARSTAYPFVNEISVLNLCCFTALFW